MRCDLPRRCARRVARRARSPARGSAATTGESSCAAGRRRGRSAAPRRRSRSRSADADPRPDRSTGAPIMTGRDMIRVAAGRGLRHHALRQSSHEDDVVPPDAVSELAGGLQHQASQRVGRHRSGAVRSRRDGRDVRHLHRSTRLCRGLRLRRDLRQRAPQQRLRPDAVAQPDRRHPRQPHLAGGHHRARQLGRVVQPADPRSPKSSPCSTCSRVVG